MLEQKDINKIKEAVEEFFEKMTMVISSIEVSLSSVNPVRKPEQSGPAELSKEDLPQKHSNNPFFKIFQKEISKDGPSNGVKKGPQNVKDIVEENRDVVNLDIELNEPQILIGQQGQTLFEIQRLLKTVLNKRLQKIFYLNLDINDYKKKKIEYLKDLAKNLADQVSLIKEEKALLPMSAYERRIIHSELSQRTDVITESQGDGFDRHIVIKPR